MTLATSHHYVPVLRWKRGERIALRELGEERLRVIPLIEPVAASAVVVDWITEFIEQVATCWGEGPFFLDVSAQGDNSIAFLPRFMKTAMSQSVAPILVTRLVSTQESRPLLKSVGISSDQGVCLRITKDDLRNAALEPRVESTLELLGRRSQDIDMIIDYGFARASDPSFAYLEDRLPRLDSWRSVIVLGGSFPKDLRGLTVGEHELPRQEWINWNKQVGAMSSRVPTFGDYTTQHAIYSEPPEGANVSASIRYTSDDYWVVMRGEGLRNKTGAGFGQYPAIAQLLMERKEYRGSAFSYGDAYISLVGSGQLATTGNPETWLRAGVNHHIVFVVKQIAETVAELSAR